MESTVPQHNGQPGANEDGSTVPSIGNDWQASGSLVVVTSDQRLFVVPLKPGGMTIGRDPDNDIVLNEPQCSRKHARIDFDGSQVSIVDLNSTNGTVLGEARLLPGIAERWPEEAQALIGWSRLYLYRGDVDPDTTI